MIREKKAEVVQQVAGLMDGATALYSIDFTGLNVADTIRLRREFKKAEVSYTVAKNTLIRRALDQVGGYDTVVERFVGQTAIAVGYDDPAAPARVLKEFLGDKGEVPKLNFAMLEGQLYEGDRLKEIASMPSRQDIMASIVGSLHAPISDIVGVMNAVMRDLSSVIEEVAKSQEAAAA